MENTTIKDFNYNVFRMNLLTKPLQRIAVGGVLTACAFFVSGFLELKIEVTRNSRQIRNTYGISKKASQNVKN